MSPLRVVVDPNVLVSLLIGKRLSVLISIFNDPRFRIIMDDLLFDELDGVARRPKFRKYFPTKKLDEVVYLIEQNAEILVSGVKAGSISRDPADDYLLGLCKRGKADVLLTGDDDLLVLETYGRTRMISPKDFIAEYLS